MGVRDASRSADSKHAAEFMKIQTWESRHRAPNGSLIYRRYNHDAYGANHVGGYWPLLAGERGDYAVMAGDMDRASAQLYLLERSSSAQWLDSRANDPPVQSTGQAEVGLGVAQPLVWAHAEDILLHRSIEEGKVFDAPRTPSESFRKSFSF